MARVWKMKSGKWIVEVRKKGHPYISKAFCSFYILQDKLIQCDRIRVDKEIMFIPSTPTHGEQMNSVHVFTNTILQIYEHEFS